MVLISLTRRACRVRWILNDRDFLSPVASYEDREGDFELVNKFMGNIFACDIYHSPLDVVAG